MGGSVLGNREMSMTRSPSTPYTRAEPSVTSQGEVQFPIGADPEI